ncbi:MAG: ABC transporter permease [Bacteroidales bacterium]|nr:ABC transporter permease [Bacteroidales bacterium]MCF8388414.1 ABC transporter permease [Bacteroidales bacterium]MCF8396915.1 ABC transporter permease [Bacteroidales bacterium]
MLRLLKIEWKKLYPYRTFWVYMIVFLLITLLVLAGIEGFLNTVTSSAQKESDVTIPAFSVYTFPHIWHNLVFLSSFLKIIPALLLIILVTNEYNFLTIRQNIISGINRHEFIAGKILIALFLSLAICVFILIAGLVLGFLSTADITIGKVTGKMIFLFAFAWELFVYFLFAVLIAILIKRSGFAIGFLLLYSFAIEPYLEYKLPGNWDRILPLNSVSNLIDVPNTSLMELFGINFRSYIPMEDFLVSLLYAVMFVAATLYFFRKSDL